MSEAAEQDLALWKVMVSGNILHELSKAPSSITLVLGPMGAGKSTAIAIQTGAKYQVEMEMVDGRMKRVYKCVQADHRRPQTSDGYTSKTLNVGLNAEHHLQERLRANCFDLSSQDSELTVGLENSGFRQPYKTKDLKMRKTL
eukprot:1756723-Amphidinium_carterae.1